MFFNRYAKIKQELTDLHSEITKLKATVDSLEQQFRSLRGYNARIQRGNKEKLESMEDEEEDDSSYDSIVKAFGGDVPIELREKYKR